MWYNWYGEKKGIIIIGMKMLEISFFRVIIIGFFKCWLVVEKLVISIFELFIF